MLLSIYIRRCSSQRLAFSPPHSKSKDVSSSFTLQSSVILILHLVSFLMVTNMVVEAQRRGSSKGGRNNDDSSTILGQGFALEAPLSLIFLYLISLL